MPRKEPFSSLAIKMQAMVVFRAGLWGVGGGREGRRVAVRDIYV